MKKILFEGKTMSILIEEAISLLWKNRNYKPGTIRGYKLTWKRIKQFMETQDIEYYGPSVEHEYLTKEYGAEPYHHLSATDRMHISKVKLLTEYQTTGEIQATRNGRLMLVKKYWPFKSKTFSILTEEASRLLKEKRNYKFKTVSNYRTAWRAIERFMSSNKIEHYNLAVEQDYIKEKYGSRSYNSLPTRDKEHVNRVKVLTDFLITGDIQPVVIQVHFSGEIGAAAEAFLLEKRMGRMHPTHVRSIEVCLYMLMVSVHANGASSIKDIDQTHIYNFLLSLDPKKTSLPRTTIDIIRPFFRYLYLNNLSDKNLVKLIPRHNYKRESVLPSLYSKEEVESILQSIDRNNPIGKRDYALVTLAARLGMRASDICNLKFENIDWEKSVITFKQLKTDHWNVLPLTEEIGEAIISYIQDSRPTVTGSINVFLSAVSPYCTINNTTLYNIVNNAFRKAGVDTKDKHHGAHSLRHSLVGRLLEEHTSFPVISEILGHQRTETTRYYVRIDLASMRQFALEVPPVNASFYNQKGGFFYE